MTTAKAQWIVDKTINTSKESQEDIRHIASKYDPRDLPLPNNLQTDALSIVRSAILRSGENTPIAKGELSFEDKWDAAEIVADRIQTLILNPVRPIPEPFTPSTYQSHGDEFQRELLGRLDTDCRYYLSNGLGQDRHLWAGNVPDQIAQMRCLATALDPPHPRITTELIDSYETRMTAVANANWEFKTTLAQAIRNGEGARMSIPRDCIQHIPTSTKAGEDVQAVRVTLPPGTTHDGVDVSGWWFYTPANNITRNDTVTGTDTTHDTVKFPPHQTVVIHSDNHGEQLWDHADAWTLSRSVTLTQARDNATPSGQQEIKQLEVRQYSPQHAATQHIKEKIRAENGKRAEHKIDTQKTQQTTQTQSKTR